MSHGKALPTSDPSAIKIIRLLLLTALAAALPLFGAGHPARAQAPSSLLHSIPAPPVGVQSGAQLGYSVAVDGGYTVVGVPYDDIGGSNSGAAKVFDSTSGALLFLLPNPSPGVDDNFGYSVAISGARVVVGAYQDDTGAGNAGSAYVYDLSGGTPTVPVTTLNNPDPAVGEYFGASVAISGTRVMVCALRNKTGTITVGSAYAYDLAGGTPSVPIAVLSSSKQAAGDRYGTSVAISGTRVVVGAQEDDTGGPDAGIAYVHDLSSGTPTVPVATLNSPGSAPGYNFGISVAISETRLVVGARGGGTGNAYVYDLNSGTPTIPIRTLPSPSSAGGLNSGISVAISGMRVVVGTMYDDTDAQDAGRAYAYDLGSAKPQVPVATFNNPSPAGDDLFGCSVAISGTRVVVGACQDNTRAADAGSAYAYDLSSATPTVPVATMNNPGPAKDDRFGTSVAVSGTRVVVGAPYDDTGATDAGSAYVYDFSSGTPTVPVATLNNPGLGIYERFGYSVAISGQRVVVGTPYGGAHVYDLSGSTPEVPVATLSDPGVDGGFGTSVAISGMRVAVGAPYADTGATNAGSAYVYDLSSAIPTIPVATLNNPDPEAQDYFGWSMAISGTRVIVGASNWMVASNAGSAHIYDLSSGTPTVPVATLNNPGLGGNERFGISVAISGTRAVVGADLDVTEGIPAGSAYVYDLGSGNPNVPVATLNNPNPQGSGYFGVSVGISGTRVVVGDVREKAWVYDLSSGTPTAPVATLNKPGPAGNASFGSSAAIDGTTVAVGAPYDDAIMLDKGSAYIFALPDVATDPPTLAAPASSTVTGSPVSVSFTLPEAALVGSVTLSLGAHQLVLASSQATAGQHGFSFNPADPTATAAIAGGSAIPDGTYTVTLSYQDALGNPVATAVNGGVVLDTTDPSINGPFSPLIVFAGTNLANYVPQAVTSDATSLTVTQDPPAGTVTSVGALTVTLTATDVAGNAASTSFTLSVRPTQPLSAALVSIGNAAPGANASGGPPSDALVISFGVPATDDDGTMAFLAKWTSASGGKGSGLFTPTNCVAKIGGASPLGGATFKTLGDPVAGGGHVAFLATLAGVPMAKAAVVFSGPPAAPAVVAQAGTVAPGFDGLPLAGGATFKSFKAVAVEGESVAILAQLTGGTGAGKVVAGNDYGLWLKDATHGLTLVLREGQTVGVRTIKTLVAFAVGNGSPGQGRGWLTQSQADGPKALALAIFTGTDKEQAVLSVGLTGGVAAFSETGLIGPGGPDLAGASFASYAVPATNAAGKSAFLGTLTVGGAVTKVNARGIFMDYGNPTYTPIARLADPAGANGETFSVLKDPVLAADDGLAFSATLKGGNARGLATTTLWWKPTAASALTLLAQGGKRPGNDLPADAQWKAFSSLAIAANRGPIFAGTMVSGKGGVTAATASGVWACDFTGAPRLLFRTGIPDAIIAGKTLKSFTLLKATVGSLGVTRSFNDDAEVVWLATFTDTSTAIIRTTVP